MIFSWFSLWTDGSDSPERWLLRRGICKVWPLCGSSLSQLCEICNYVNCVGLTPPWFFVHRNKCPSGGGISIWLLRQLCEICNNVKCVGLTPWLFFLRSDEYSCVSGKSSACSLWSVISSVSGNSSSVFLKRRITDETVLREAPHAIAMLRWLIPRLCSRSISRYLVIIDPSL